MSHLSNATKPTSSAPMITIVSSAGCGKTTLAGMFPNPIFIQAENAETVFENWHDDVKPTMMVRLQDARIDSTGELSYSVRSTITDQLRELATAEHEFKTVVIDTITALNLKFESEIALRDGVATVGDASGGYQKGYVEVAKWHDTLISNCEKLKNIKGMTVVFLAHSGIDKIKSRPDEQSEYAVYGLGMHRASAERYITNSDAVIYIKKEEFITGAETNKKGQTTKFGRSMQTGERILITSGDGLVGYVAAKNRYGMPAELPCPQGENPIMQYIKHFNKTETTTKSKEV